MTWSGRTRQRDRHQGRRQFEEEPRPPSAARVFLVTGEQREHIAACLRDIDEARRALEARHSAENREVVRALLAAADDIYELLNALEEVADA